MLSQRSHREFPAPDRGYSCKVTRRSGASCQYLYLAPRSAVFDLSDPLGKEALIIMSEYFSIQDLSVSMGGHQILDHLSLPVENPGHMIALLGPNGSGKTTLLRAICGELSHSGHVLLNGQDLTALSPKALAGLVSYIPQQSGISISMSALDVVLMGFYSRLKLFEQPSAKMREAALQALASVGMDDFANRDYLTLSGGEQQLVILARTLIEDTSLLLFDEPDSSLDLGNKYRMMGLVADMVHAARGSGGSVSRTCFFSPEEGSETDTVLDMPYLQSEHAFAGKTAILCLHDPTLALAYCDILLLLKDGRLIHTLHPKTDPIAVMEQAFSDIYGEVRLVPVPDPSNCAGNRLILLPIL